MNLTLVRVGLLVSIAVNIILASSVLYQNRGVIRADDPRFPGVISKLESQLKKLDNRVGSTMQDYQAKADSKLADGLAKAEEVNKTIQSQLKELEKTAKAYYDRTDKLEAAGAKTDQAIHYVGEKLKKLVK